MKYGNWNCGKRNMYLFILNEKKIGILNQLESEFETDINMGDIYQQELVFVSASSGNILEPNF